MDIRFKHCPRCKTEKPATPEYFYRNSKAPDGLHCYCKACKSEIHKQYSKTKAGRTKIRLAIKKYEKTPKGKLKRKIYDAARWQMRKKF